MKPFVVCHMMVSLDGRILPSRWTRSPDGTRADWSAAYQEIHEKLAVQGWIVGRVTMAEMSKAGPHPPQDFAKPSRSRWLNGKRASYAIAVDPSGKLHFDKADIDGDAALVLLGGGVSDAHLAELERDGVSYLVSPGPDIDLPAALDALGSELGIKRLALEGGGGVNAAFFAAGLVDEISLLVAPALDGASDSRALAEAGPAGLAGAAQLSLTSCERLPHGLVWLRYAVLPG